MFNWYVGLLALSGVIMLVLAAMRQQNDWSRALNAIFGVGFLGYAFYLAFLFDGGSYFIFFQAFILPVMMVVNYFRNRTPKPKLTDTQKAWREYQSNAGQ